MKPYTGPLMTLGGAAAHAVRLVVWCRDCRHQVEPDPAVHAARYGADLAVLDWVKQMLTVRQSTGRFRAHRRRAVRIARGFSVTALAIEVGRGDKASMMVSAVLSIFGRA